MAVGIWEGKRAPEILEVPAGAPGFGDVEGGEGGWVIILVHDLSLLASKMRMERRLVAFTPALVQTKASNSFTCYPAVQHIFIGPQQSLRQALEG